jgi:hypothetical protein
MGDVGFQTKSQTQQMKIETYTVKFYSIVNKREQKGVVKFQQKHKESERLAGHSKAGNDLSPGVQDHPGQHRETLSQIKGANQRVRKTWNSQ